MLRCYQYGAIRASSARVESKILCFKHDANGAPNEHGGIKSCLPTPQVLTQTKETNNMNMKVLLIALATTSLAHGFISVRVSLNILGVFPVETIASQFSIAFRFQLNLAITVTQACLYYHSINFLLDYKPPSLWEFSSRYRLGCRIRNDCSRLHTIRLESLFQRLFPRQLFSSSI